MSIIIKECEIMKIAVTYENGQIFQHFGHTETFKIYEIDGKDITESKTIGTEGNGHGALSGFLKSKGVDILICGGIGAGAKTALSEAGIKLFGGVSGNADQAVKDYLNGNLSYKPDIMCSHHDHDHQHGKNCGHGNCGSHE